jgi:hypothetical protein
MLTDKGCARSVTLRGALSKPGAKCREGMVGPPLERGAHLTKDPELPHTKTPRSAGMCRRVHGPYQQPMPWNALAPSTLY